jgi:hypothetical protein
MKWVFIAFQQTAHRNQTHFFSPKGNEARLSRTGQTKDRPGFIDIYPPDSGYGFTQIFKLHGVAVEHKSPPIGDACDKTVIVNIRRFPGQRQGPISDFHQSPGVRIDKGFITCSRHGQPSNHGTVVIDGIWRDPPATRGDLQPLTGYHIVTPSPCVIMRRGCEERRIRARAGKGEISQATGWVRHRLNRQSTRIRQSHMILAFKVVIWIVKVRFHHI